MDEKEARVKRKQWIVTGIIVIILLAGGTLLLQINTSAGPQEPTPQGPVSGLAYCSDDQVRPCVASFSLDMDGNMLVNLLLPDRFFPSFRLEILRSADKILLDCRRSNTAPNSAYCVGERLPPGETLHLMLVSTRDDVLLAEGSLTIIGLAFPTLEVVSPTPEIAPTEPTAVPLTDLPVTPTPSLPLMPSPTHTKPSYPNPSYP